MSTNCFRFGTVFAWHGKKELVVLVTPNFNAQFSGKFLAAMISKVVIKWNAIQTKDTTITCNATIYNGRERQASHTSLFVFVIVFKSAKNYVYFN